MKTKAWGAVVMVAMAWVLWQNTIKIGERGFGSDIWQMYEVYERRATCQKDRIRMYNQLKKGKETTFIGFFVIGKKETTNIICVPTDFDPRPKK